MPGVILEPAIPDVAAGNLSTISVNPAGDGLQVSIGGAAPVAVGGGGSGGVEPRAGADLTNASVTVNPASDAASLYTLPAATLTANRALTLGTSGSPVTNSVVQIVRRDLTAHTLTIKDDAGTTLVTFAASPASAQGASFYFDGTHFVFLSFYFVA